MKQAETKPSARERILSTASRLFYEFGVRAVGVDRIIAEASVAKRTFYVHFKSKDLLILAFLRDRDGTWLTWLQKRIAALAAKPKDKPLAVFDALAERFARADFRGCAFNNTIVEMADHDHIAHKAAAEHKEKVRQYIASLIAGAGYDGADQLSRELLLLIDGAIVMAIRDADPTPARLAKNLAQLLLASKPKTKERR